MAFDAFLKISTIPGECTDHKHKDWIEVIDYAHSVRQADAAPRNTGGAATAARCHPSSLPFSLLVPPCCSNLSNLRSLGRGVAGKGLEICGETW